MAGLDVGFLTSDPALSDLFDVHRRAEVIGTNGRTTTTDQWFRKQRGVVAAGDPADLMRRDDGQMVPRVIEINARFKFQGAEQGFQPDAILWKGIEYMVEKVFPFSNFGKGHTRVVAASTAAIDPPLT